MDAEMRYRANRLVTAEDRALIASAIEKAERKTSGEIVAVIASESDDYFYVPFMWAGLAALLVPWLLIVVTWLSTEMIYLVQLAVFIILVVALYPRPIRLMLVPREIKRRHAHRRAVEQFLAQSLHTTAGRTGVLIFVSLAERHAEILADTAIDSRVPEGTWQQIVDDMVARLRNGLPAQAFVTAIEEIGVHLAKHFPPGSVDPNELPNHLIVLD